MTQKIIFQKLTDFTGKYREEGLEIDLLNFKKLKMKMLNHKPPKFEEP